MTCAIFIILDGFWNLQFKLRKLLVDILFLKLKYLIFTPQLKL
jgi:hypothetical protein